MPNGGTLHCGHCCHFVGSEARCSLRGIPIQRSHWTTCRNVNRPASDPIGPVYAIVCEVRDRAGSYGNIPYFNGCRVDTVQLAASGDTVVRFRDPEGKEHDFETVADYLAFYEKSVREF